MFGKFSISSSVSSILISLLHLVFSLYICYIFWSWPTFFRCSIIAKLFLLLKNFFFFWHFSLRFIDPASTFTDSLFGHVQSTNKPVKGIIYLCYSVSDSLTFSLDSFQYFHHSTYITHLFLLTVYFYIWALNILVIVPLNFISVILISVSHNWVWFWCLLWLFTVSIFPPSFPSLPFLFFLLLSLSSLMSCQLFVERCTCIK